MSDPRRLRSINVIIRSLLIFSLLISPAYTRSGVRAAPAPRPAGQAGEPAINFTKSDSLLIDQDGDGLVGAGDTLRYTLTAHNTGPLDASGVWLEDSLEDHLSLVPGSLRTTPLAYDQVLETLEDSAPHPFVLSGVDFDGDLLAYEIVTPPAHGSLGGTPPNLTYQPAAPDYTGPDSLAFKVCDAATPANCDSAAVQVTIQPVNDAPAFTSASTTVTALEDSGPFTLPGWAAAITPGPANESGQALHFEVTHDQDSLFADQPELSADGTLAFTPAGDQYGQASLSVTLRDDGGTANGGVDTSAAQSLTVEVLPVNDAPSFTAGPDVTINEDAGPQSLAGWAAEISAGPHEAGQVVHFEVTGNSYPGLFAVPPAVSADGTLAFQTALDQTGTAEITLRLVDDGGSDHGGSNASAEQTFQIIVQEYNDPPRGEPAAFTIAENSPPGAEVGTVTIIDADAGQLHEFGISAGNTGGAFAIDPSSGLITVANPDALDYETTPAFHLTITITDDGTPPASGTAAITVQLSDVNDAPVVTPSTFTLPENSASGTLAGTLAWNDVEDGAVTFAITAGNTGGAFAVDGSGQITVASRAALDFETTPTFTLTVEATDDGAPPASGSAAVTVHLSNVNEPPQVSDDAFTVDEFSPNDTLVGSITVSDPETSQTHTLRILSGNTGGAFALSTDGALRVADSSALDYNLQPVFTLTIEASDSGTPALSATGTITVQVNNRNDPPEVAGGSYTLDENSPDGTEVAQVTFTDRDSDQAHTFAITGGNPGGAFAIHPTTGMITTSGKLDYETLADYALEVTVTDDGVPPISGSAVVHVTLRNVNEPPAAAPAAFSVRENSPAGTVVDRLDVSDPETSQSHTFVIQSGNTGGAFAVNSRGEITVASQAALNYEVLNTYTLAVQVTDSGSPAASATISVTVSLIDVNEAPTIAGATITIPENQPRGTIVTTLALEDPDSGQTHEFYIATGNHGGAFTVDADGRITVNTASALDYDNPALRTFTLGVVVADSGTPILIGQAEVTIHLTDVNEAPVVSGETYQAVGNTLLEVAAASAEPAPRIFVAGSLLANDSDPDAGDTLRCELNAASAGAVVTVKTNGTFTYLPPAGAASDSFTYRVIDAQGLSTTGTVTIELVGRVWYVKNNAPAGGSGRSADPFNTLASAQAASKAGDTIYVHYGNGTITGQNAGITLKDSQRLIGAGAALELPAAVNGGPNPTPLLPADEQPWIHNTTSGGSAVTINNVSAEVRGLNIAASGSAVDAVYSDPAEASLTITDNTIRGAGAEGIDIDTSSNRTLTAQVHNNAITATGSGFDLRAAAGSTRLAFSNNSLTSSASGIVITRTGGTELTITAFADNQVSGDTRGSGAVIQNAVFDATPGGSINQVLMGTFTAGTSMNPVDGSGLEITNTRGNLRFSALTIYAAGAYGLNSSGVASYSNGGLTLAVDSGQGSIAATHGAALALSTLSVNASNLALHSGSSPTVGISLTNVNGTLSTTNTSEITNSIGTAFLVDGGSASVTYNGTIQQSAGRTILVTKRTSNGLTFNGSVTGGGTGVLLNANTGGTVSFNGGLVLNTGANAAFTATSAGTLAITGTANTLTTTTGTALKITDTTINNNDLKFRSIFANGAPVGIELQNTGNQGGLTVTGTGAAGSGGVIQNTTGDGVRVNNTHSLTLNYMTISNAAASQTGTGCGAENAADCRAAVNLMNATNVVLNHLSAAGSGQMGLSGYQVNGLTITNSSVTGAGNSNDEYALLLHNPTGTLLIEDCTFSYMYETGIRLYKTDASAANLTLRRVTLTDNLAATGEDGFQFKLAGSGQANILVENSTFTNLQRDGIDGLYLDNSRLNLTVRSNRFENNFGLGGIVLVGSAPSTENAAEGYLTLHSNTLRNTVSTPVVLTSAAYAKLDAQITQNTISHPSPPAEQVGEGIRLSQEENSTMTVLVSGNQISNTFARDISGYSRLPAASGSLHATVLNNTAAVPSNSPAYAIDFNVQEPNHTICLDIAGNRATGNADAGIRVRNSAGTFEIEGAPEPLSPAAAASYINTRNTSNAAAEATVGMDRQFTGVTAGTCRDASGAALPSVTMNPAAPYAQGSTRVPGLARPIAPQQAADPAVQIHLDRLPAGKSVKVTLDVRVADPLPEGVFQIANQASLRGENFTTVLSDDPATPRLNGDPTVTLLYGTPVALDDLYTLNEDATLTVPAPGVLDNDLAAAGFTLTGALDSGPALGSLTLSAGGGLEYTPPPDLNGSQTFTYVASDGTDTSNPALVTLQILPVNDAPVLDMTGAMRLNPVYAGESGSTGTPINALLSSAGSPISDRDDNSLQGIAITAADTTRGQWQYTTTGGLSWHNLGAVSSTAARLLASDANTRLRLITSTGFAGTINPAIAFRAWDRTTGTNGSTADVTTNGGSTAFSTAVGTASIEVTAAADLDLDMTASESATLAGNTLVYSLAARNLGPSPAAGISVRSTLPAGVSLVSTGAGCGAAGGVVTCTAPSLEPGVSASFDLTVKVDADFTGLLSNTAQVTAATHDPVSTNNSAGASVSVSEKAVVLNPLDPVDPGLWNNPTTSQPVCGIHFMGEYSNETVTLTLTDLPQHSEVTLEFDLLVIRSWDGNLVEIPEQAQGAAPFRAMAGETIGPDRWSLSVDGGTLLDTTFSNWDELGFDQAYPGSYPGGSYQARTGASANNNMCFNYDRGTLDSTYHLRYTIPHDGTDLQVDFAASGLQSIADESWGLDNVKISLSAGADTAPNFLFLPAINR